MDSSNPFIQKAMRDRGKQIALQNLRALEALLKRFGPEDTGPGKDRVSARVKEAHAAVQSYE